MCMLNYEGFFSPKEMFCFDVPHCSQINGHMESSGGGGDVKGHLWGFVGPPYNGHSYASGGSNFSKLWRRPPG